MKRKALLAIAAAGVVAAIIVLTTGAFAGTSGRSDQPPDGFAAFISCLASHGVQVPSDDPAAVKPWLADHQTDPAVQAALQACAPPDDAGTDLTPAELVACLERHGVDVPSDVKETPDALKPWLVEALKQPSVSAALDECTGGPAPNGAEEVGKAGKGVAAAAPSRPRGSHSPGSGAFAGKLAPSPCDTGGSLLVVSQSDRRFEPGQPHSARASKESDREKARRVPHPLLYAPST